MSSNNDQANQGTEKSASSDGHGGPDSEAVQVSSSAADIRVHREISTASGAAAAEKDTEFHGSRSESRKSDSTSDSSATNVASTSSTAKRKFANDHDQDTVALRADGRRLVERGSLVESELMEAVRKVRSNKDKDSMTEDEKREERRAANRLSAFQSRKRRKSVIEGLQQTLARLSSVSADQLREIAQLKHDNQMLAQENQVLRSQFLARGSSAPMDATPSEVNRSGSFLQGMVSRVPEHSQPQTSQSNEVLAMFQELEHIQNHQARQMQRTSVNAASSNSAVGNFASLQRQAQWPPAVLQLQLQQQQQQQVQQQNRVVLDGSVLSQQLQQQLAMLRGMPDQPDRKNQE